MYGDVEMPDNRGATYHLHALLTCSDVILNRVPYFNDVTHSSSGRVLKDAFKRSLMLTT